VIGVFAAVLALDSCDKATVSASAVQLQDALDIGRPQIGLLLTVTGLVGAVATVPAGTWVDRTVRTRLLAGAVATWGLAMFLSGLATGFTFLLCTRALLAVITAVSGPAVASLIGDYFPEHERGRIYGYVLSGELIGVGFGFVVSGQLATISWRVPFFALVAPTAVVWWFVHRLPEPERGGGSRLERVPPPREDAQPPEDARPPAASSPSPVGASGEPEPQPMRLVDAVRYVLGVRTNVVLIAASALGYFYFSGVRGFAVEFVSRQYTLNLHVATSMSLVLGVGGLGGILVGGRVADALLRRGRLTARIDVAGVAILLSAAFFLPALITHSVWVALPLLTCAAACLGATTPPLDAARLDIIRPALWGRAESVRTLLRNLADAAAPLLFGVVSASVFAASSGLRDTFLLALVSLVTAGALVLLVGRRTYPADAAATGSIPSRSRRGQAARMSRQSG
jgi:predicted MFS family arabinose efflux permease